MNKRILLLLVLLVPMLLIPTSALSDSLWVVGQVSTTPTEEIYGSEHYWQFNFTVGDTNRTDLVAVGTNITVLCWTEIGTIQDQAYYNFSGAINDVQVDEIPQGVFIVLEIIGTTTPTDWAAIFKLVVEIFSSVMRGIASTIVLLVALATGIMIPAWLVTLVLVVILFGSLLKYAKTIGFLMIIILGFLVVSGGADLLRTLVWAA